MAKQILAESTATASLMPPHPIVIISQFCWDPLGRRAPHEKHSEGTVKASVYRVMQIETSYHVGGILWYTLPFADGYRATIFICR